MKHKYIYMFYLMILLSAISWRVTRAYPVLSEIKDVNISESENQTLISIDLSKPTKAVPFLKSSENCLILDFDKTIMSSKLKTRAFAGRDVKLAYMSALDNSIEAFKTNKPKNSKKVRAKFFFNPDCLPSVKYLDNKVFLKLAVRETSLKPCEPENSLLHPQEKKYAPVVISLENAPFKAVVSEIATQAGMDLNFAGSIPENLTIELQSEDPFDALCTIAEKTNMKFYRDGKNWFLEGEKLAKK